MPKRTKKLLVYLDQNFLSEIAKLDSSDQVKPEFRKIYELLHNGFVDEKLVVPSSWVHDIESSLASHLKDQIVRHQHYLGQVRLKRPDEIENTQVSTALDLFLGNDREDPLRPEAAFNAHPDQRVKRFGISINQNLEQFNFRAGRQDRAKRLDELRLNLGRRRVTYESQLKVEKEETCNQFLNKYARLLAPLTEERYAQLAAFSESQSFENIPRLSITNRLTADILTRKTRQIQFGDTTDIEFLSAYLAYMDVVCTDTFMAEQLRTLRIDKEFDVRLFTAKTGSLNALKTFLEDYLKDATPANRPSITAFVLPPKDNREGSHAFFHQLGGALAFMGINDYAEIYAFDDGNMPKYEYAQSPGVAAPFYGLQDVTPIEIRPGISGDEILKLCREHCHSDSFVLIDEYKTIPRAFLSGAAMSAERNMATTQGYRIYKRLPIVTKARNNHY